MILIQNQSIDSNQIIAIPSLRGSCRKPLRRSGRSRSAGSLFVGEAPSLIRITCFRTVCSVSGLPLRRRALGFTA